MYEHILLDPEQLLGGFLKTLEGHTAAVLSPVKTQAIVITAT